MRLAPRLNRTNHQRASHTTFDNQYGHKKTNTKYRNTNQPFPSALSAPILFFPANTPLTSHLKHPLFQSLSRFTGIGFIRTKRNQFFFGEFSQQSSSRSPREGVDTCRDRALNASGQGYYGQAKADSACEGRVSLSFTQSGLSIPAAAGVVDEKGSEYIFAHTGPRELDGHPLGGCGSGFGSVPGYTTLSVRVRANI